MVSPSFIIPHFLALKHFPVRTNTPSLESDSKDKLIEVLKLKARAKQLSMLEPVERVFEEELTSKLTHLEPVAP